MPSDADRCAVRKSKKNVKDVTVIAQSKASAEDKLKQFELKCLQHVSLSGQPDRLRWVW